MTKPFRFISSRSPYERGGLTFDRSSKRTAEGHALVELDLVGLERLGEDGFCELVRDPSITIEVMSEDGQYRKLGAAPGDHEEWVGRGGRDPADGQSGHGPAPVAPAGPGDALKASEAPADRGASRRGASSSHSKKA